MTKEELKQKIGLIEHDADLKKRAVYREYVKDNAKAKVGDIVSDTACIIRVEKICYSLYGGGLSIFYQGPQLTKMLKPRKDGSICVVYESSMIERKSL